MLKKPSPPSQMFPLDVFRGPCTDPDYLISIQAKYLTVFLMKLKQFHTQTTHMLLCTTKKKKPGEETWGLYKSTHKGAAGTWYDREYEKNWSGEIWKKSSPISFNSSGEVIETKTEMKVLGLIFDQQMDWKSHANKAVNKVNRLPSGLRFLRKRLNKKPLLNAVNSQFYGLLYYGCQVWLGQHTRSFNVRKLNSGHYRVLRIVKNDWKKKKKRSDLDSIGRARPSLWGKYATGNLVIKLLKNCLALWTWTTPCIEPCLLKEEDFKELNFLMLQNLNRGTSHFRIESDRFSTYWPLIITKTA